jgi:Ni/Co efflux regulator RcnB
MKSVFAASLVALSALAVGPLAHAEQDDPSTYQLNRWGAPVSPEGYARYAEEAARQNFPQTGVPTVIAPQYLNPGYFLNWQALQLPAPLAGYQWLAMNDRYVMADQITGAIARSHRRLR